MVNAKRLILVRHGEAAAKWGQSTDPGLSALGRDQARLAAEQEYAATGSLTLYTSPLKRAVETMLPFERTLDAQSTVIPQLAEIPSGHIPMAQRQAWLKDLKQSTWQTQPERLQIWRKGIINFLLNCPSDSLMTTHFAVINVAVGHALGLEDIFSFHPDNCSATIFDLVDGKLQLIGKGLEAQTRINL